MNKSIIPLSLSLLMLLGAGCVSVEIEPETEPSSGMILELNPIDEVTQEDANTSTAPVFAPDAMVLENASNPGVKLDENLNVLLLFENHAEGFERTSSIATAEPSSDWLEFTVTVEQAIVTNFRALELPDGTYRAYMAGMETGADTTKGTGPSEISKGFISMSSEDGITFTQDEGYRYLLQPEDKESIGVWETFVDESGGVVLLYIGDKMGENSVRRAYSEDGGWSFEFDRDNVLESIDDYAPGTYVDEKILSLGDGRWRLIAMRQGIVYTFLSEDDGYSFELEGEVLAPNDFPDYNLATLNDPQLIMLPDGRQRIYVTGIEW
ncbi:hypothetical protein CO174_02865, partial [Candidatus Uhrbacteria bacterium CG_4_9_14_3_um_filter_50_9]